MKCCLWLAGVKVWKTGDIINNFDLVSLRGYYQGGSLLRWLKANGGEDEARKLEETTNIEDLNARLEYAFGLREKPPENQNAAPEREIIHADAEKTPWRGSYYGEYKRSFVNKSSFNIGSFGSGSYNFGTFYIGSYNLGINIGSYNFGTFNISSYNFGTFNISSFNIGSFNYFNSVGGVRCFLDFFGYGIGII